MKSFILSSIIILFSFYGKGQIPIASYNCNGNFQDASSNNHHGIVSGATLTTGRNGTPNGAYFFDGIDDYVTLPSSIQFTPLTSSTVSFWLKTTQTTRFDIMNQRIGSHSPSNDNFQLSYNHTSTEDIVYAHPQYAPSHGARLSSLLPNYNDGGWHHFVYIKNVISDSMHIYYDCQKIASRKLTDATFTINGQIIIGKHYNNLKYYKGSIDDIKLYDNALNFNEIEKDCNENDTNTTFSIETPLKDINIYFTESKNLRVSNLNSSYSIKVFNSQGEQVFLSKNYKNDWIANKISSGIYYYIIEDQQNKSYTGKILHIN